jgi:hypothetical protein
MTIRGQRQYLCRAVDQDGDVIDILLQTRRDRHAAARFFRKLLKRSGRVPHCLGRAESLGADPIAPGRPVVARGRRRTWASQAVLHVLRSDYKLNQHAPPVGKIVVRINSHWVDAQRTVVQSAPVSKIGEVDRNFD